MSWNQMFKFIGPALPVCSFRLYVPWTYTMFHTYNMLESFKFLLWMNELFSQFLQLMSLSQNAILCIDLVVTLGAPFEVAGKRMNYYNIICLVFSTLLTAINWTFQDQKYYRQGDISKTVFSLNHMILAFSVTLYLMIAIYSVVFSSRRLNRPGMSKELRQLFSKKHT